MRYVECARKILLKQIISHQSTNGSFTKYLLEIGTGILIEGSVRLVKQGLSIWWNRGKDTEAGEIRNWRLGELSVWRNRGKETKAENITNRMLM